MTKEKNKYDLVFISDSRQKDIFQYYKKTKPFFEFSSESKTLNEATDKKWIIDFVGKDIHRMIKLIEFFVLAKCGTQLIKV